MGTEITKQGRRDQALLNIDERADPWGMPYFWFGFERPPSTLVAGTDLAAIDHGRISVTPLVPQPHARCHVCDAGRRVCAGHAAEGRKGVGAILLLKRRHWSAAFRRARVHIPAQSLRNCGRITYHGWGPVPLGRGMPEQFCRLLRCR